MGLTPAEKSARRGEQLYIGRDPKSGNSDLNPLQNRTGLFDEVPTTEEMQLLYGTDVKPFQRGSILHAPEEYFLHSDEQRRLAGLQPDSAYENASSAYDAMGSSAYKQLGPSAYRKLAFDPNQMGESQDYFASVMRDPTDDIAEADYARRQGQAEQQRRSHADAALAENEMRGQGGAGDRMLAELSGTQAMTGDMYQAGLDANATAQMRRDSAAGSLADVSERMGRNTLDADTARASGLDAYSSNRASALDAYGANRAAGRDAFTGAKAAGMDDWANNQYDYFYDTQTRNTDRFEDANLQNWLRGNSVNDQNTSTWNDTTYHNMILAPQQEFRNLEGVVAGATKQYEATTNLLADEKARKDARTDAYVDRTINAVSNLAAASAQNQKK